MTDDDRIEHDEFALESVGRVSVNTVQIEDLSGAPCWETWIGWPPRDGSLLETLCPPFTSVALNFEQSEHKYWASINRIAELALQIKRGERSYD